MNTVRDLRDGYLYNRAHKRLKRLSASEVVRWADTSLVATQQALEAYGRSRDAAALDEAHRGAIVILAAVDALQQT